LAFNTTTIFLTVSATDKCMIQKSKFYVSNIDTE